MIKIVQLEIFPGRHFGFHHRSLLIAATLADRAAALASLRKLASAFEPYLLVEAQRAFSPTLDQEGSDIGNALVTLLNGLEIVATLPVLDRRIHYNAAKGYRPTLQLVVESLEPEYTAASLSFLMRTLAGLSTAGDHAAFSAKFADEMAAHVEKRPSVGKAGSNTWQFIRAARKLNVPAVHLPQGTVLYGWGKRSMLMQSSITQNTGTFSVSIARDKANTREFLRRARLPVTRQRVVHTLEDAVEAAREIGYPLVVKPRALDGGQGVTTNLRNEEDLGRAFAKTKALASDVLVEAQIIGREYRLLVVKDQLLSVHERVPAQVVGNGQDAISHLIEAENARRWAAEGAGISKLAITLTDDMHECLAVQGFDMQTVPGDGQVVRLATVPKVVTGGEARPLDPASIHPDVVDAVLRAVRLLRLDVAGVDYIAPDAAKSWREGEGAITEVNAGPQINRFDTYDIHVRYIEALLPDGGRVPAVLLLDDGEQGARLVGRIAARLREEGVGLGIIAPSLAWAEQIERSVVSSSDFSQAFVTLADPKVDCILVVQSLSDIFARGFALDRFDSTALCSPAGAKELRQLAAPRFSTHLASEFLVPHTQDLAPQFRLAGSSARVRRFSDEDELLERIVANLRGLPKLFTRQPAAEDNHAS